MVHIHPDPLPCSPWRDVGLALSPYTYVLVLLERRPAIIQSDCGKSEDQNCVFLHICWLVFSQPAQSPFLFPTFTANVVSLSLSHFCSNP